MSHISPLTLKNIRNMIKFIFPITMDPTLVILSLLMSFLLPLYVLLVKKKKRASKRLPPGDMGLPILGQTLSFLRAMRHNTAETWVRDRINRYGDVSKLNLIGTPTVFLHGQAANKFVYTCDGTILGSHQPASIRRLMGDRNLFEVSANEHKRIRGALNSFLKPEALKQHVGAMDDEIRAHMNLHWHGKDKVQAMTLMKTLTFSIMSSLIIGLEQGKQRDTLVELFQDLIEGMLAIPINLPFTRFNRALRVRAKIRSSIMGLIHQRRKLLEAGQNPKKDLISSLIVLRDEGTLEPLSDEEIVDNVILVMIAGHDTSSILLSFFIRILAKEPSVHAAVLQEQEGIAASKGSGEVLTWEDLGKMKYTWRVAMECLRMTPPVFCSFRTVLTDFEYEGYLIPKGWQVMWASFMTHLDENLFPDPTKLDPTRSERQASSPPYSFMGFGGGPRMCPGYEFAKMETLSTIHYLVTRFTWKLGSPDQDFSREPMPMFKDGLEILIHPRIS